MHFLIGILTIFNILGLFLPSGGIAAFFLRGEAIPIYLALGFVAIGTLKALLVRLLGNHGEPSSTAWDLVPGYQFSFDSFLAGHRINIDFQQG